MKVFILFYSVPHPFKGDYLNLRGDMKWKKIHSVTNDINVVFADLVHKVNRANGKVGSISMCGVCFISF